MIVASSLRLDILLRALPGEADPPRTINRDRRRYR